jgi:hypothetical protein
MGSTPRSEQIRSAHWAAEKSPSGAIDRPRGAIIEWELPPLAPQRVQKGRVHVSSFIAFWIGVAATFAFGDTARQMIARSSPRLSSLAPEPFVEVSTVASSDHEELKAISFGLTEVRERVDQIAAQLAAGQEQITRDITKKLEAAEQDIADKISSAVPPRPALAPARSSR